MGECVNFSKCRFFIENMKNSPSTAAMVQKNYCLSRFEECARYKIFLTLGESKMPRDLSPSEKERAEQIIKAG